MHGAKGDMDNAEKVLQKMDDAKVKPAKSTYLAMLKGYARKGEMEEAGKVVTKGREANMDDNVAM